jgi:hypothetical protein
MTDGPFRPRGQERPDPPPAPPPADPAAPRRHGRPTAPRRPPGRASAATWLLGVAFVVLVAYVTLNTIRADKPGSRGVRPGTELPPFAVPLATSTLQGDANVFVRRTKGVPRACDVRGPRVLNSCQLAERGPVVLTFLATRSQKCIDEVDRVDALRPRFPDVQFAAVAIRGSRDDLRRIVRRHGWRLPVGYDRDGAVSNAYAIAVCPTITFARAGGKVAATTLGVPAPAELVRHVEAIRR